MSSTSKNSKNICKVDRISDLPDSLLIIILSLLGDFKSVVRTSILSKRWTPLCHSLPNLIFYDNKNSTINFTNFVDRFLMRRPNHLKIDKFWLHCGGGDYYWDRISEWISNAVERDLKEITLYFAFPWLYELDQDFFYMCTSVEVLRLCENILVDIQGNVKLLRLGEIQFSEVTFSSYQSVGKLLLNCPVLEDLSFFFCEWLTGNSFSICGSALKKLLLLTSSSSDDLEMVLRILIDTPRLENLEISPYIDGDILFKENFPLLKVAVIDIHQISGVHAVFGLLRKINHVKILTLTDNTVLGLNRAYDCGVRTVHYEFPPFYNLTELKINVETYCDETLLDDFLQNSPNFHRVLFVVTFLNLGSARGLGQNHEFQNAYPPILKQYILDNSMEQMRS